jgi:uncharacterized protein
MTVNSPEPPDLPEMSRGQILIVMAVTAIILLIVTRTWMFFGPIALFPCQLEWRALGWGIVFASVIAIAKWWSNP